MEKLREQVLAGMDEIGYLNNPQIDLDETDYEYIDNSRAYNIQETGRWDFSPEVVMVWQHALRPCEPVPWGGCRLAEATRAGSACVHHNLVRRDRTS